MCPDDNELSALAGGTLPESRAAELRSHVEGCDDCRVVFASLQSASSAAPGAHPLPGSLVGKYQVLSPLGAGAMGVVFLAFDSQLERRVALKFVPKALDEARKLARLSHPNVVQVHEVFTHGEFEVIAMEFVEGENLRQWLASTPPRTLEERAQVLKQAALGLAAAHASNIVHRDFKPENVLVGRDGRVRVSDFGLSRHAANSQQRGALVTSLAGTPAYMAPELHRAESASAASDQYALCVTALEVLTGQRPEGKSARVPPGHRPWLRGLEPNPASRWPSIDALLDALERPARWRLRSWRIAVAVMALLAGVAWWRATRPPELPLGCAKVAGAIDALVAPQFTEQLRAHLSQRAYSSAAQQRTLEFLTKNADEARQLLEQTCVVETETSRMQLQLLRLTCLERVVDKNRALLDGVLKDEGPGSQGLAAYHLLQSQPRSRCGADRLVRAQAASEFEQDPGELQKKADAIEARFDRRDQLTLRADLEPLIDEARRTQRFHVLAQLLRVRAAVRFDDGDHDGERADLEEGLLVCESNGFDALLLEFTTARMSASKTSDETRLWFELAKNRAARLGQGEAMEGDLLLSYGLAFWNLGDLAAAHTQVRNAAEVWRRVLTPDDPMVASTEVLEGQALVEMGRFDEGDVLLTRGREVLATRMGKDSLHLVDSTRVLTMLALWKEDVPRARAEFERLRALRAKTDGDSEGAQEESALISHWLATLSGEPTSSPSEVGDDQQLLLALIDAEDLLARGDAKGAREVLAKRPQDETGPLAVLARSYEAEVALALGEREVARTTAEEVVKADQHRLATARGLWVLGSLEKARALVVPGSRFAARVK